MTEDEENELLIRDIERNMVALGDFCGGLRAQDPMDSTLEEQVLLAEIAWCFREVAGVPGTPTELVRLWNGCADFLDAFIDAGPRFGLAAE